MPRFRIAYVVSHPIQYQAPLLRHLAEDGAIDVSVLFLSDLSTRSYRDPGFGHEVEWDTPLLEGYRHVFLPAWGSPTTLSFWQPLTRGLGREITRGRFDALWVHGYAHQALLQAMRLGRRRGLPVLLRGESHLKSHPRGRARALVKDVLLRWLFARLDGFLAIGSLNRSYYRHYGVGDDRLFSMPYAVDNAFFRTRAAESRPGRAGLRAELGLPAGAPVILFASKLVARKRARDLLSAFERLRAGWTGEPPALVFVGDGPERPELEARAAGGGTVRFAGFRNQSQMPRFYDLCDVFVLPSEHEPWGLVVNEVMNAGRPVVVSDHVGAGADLVVNGENGFVFPKGDVAALAGALVSVLRDPHRKSEMGRRSLDKVAGWSFEQDREGLLSSLHAVTGR